MRRVRGGEVVGDVASHFLYPGVLGFEQAGGFRGTGVDFLADPDGDRALAARYMRAAGYAERQIHGRRDPPGRRPRRRAGQQRRADRRPDAARPRLQDEPQARRELDHVRALLRAAESQGGGLPERRLGARLRRPADGARHRLQRQVHLPREQPELAAAERPERERGDRQSGAGRRQRGARRRVGRRSTDWSPRRAARSRGCGTDSRTSSRPTCAASRSCGTSVTATWSYSSIK